MKEFLNQYDTILLDMDGVITSEEIYWDTAALTVWEMLHSRLYFGTEDIDPVCLTKKVKAIRSLIFAKDTLIQAMKNRGLNNNWDLAWIVVSTSLIHKTTNFNEIAAKLYELPNTAANTFQTLSADLTHKAHLSETESAHLGGLWKKVQLCFQEWFVGNDQFPHYWNHPNMQLGKEGLSFREEPLVEKEPLLSLLRNLGQSKRLGIGSGRPWNEATTPLKRWGVLDAFAPDAIITYQEVTVAQKNMKKEGYDEPLNKPHPYTFLKGVFGNRYTDDELVYGHYQATPCSKTLVIGDALCDLYAAKRAGCDFLAVLTGAGGDKSRKVFETEKADYILHSILDLLES
ncbi:MAG: HAD family hydrolase [Ruminococcaceae bacterium]|nr:HAD family hydrolase [Oscillospiraceae bacterium]